MRKTFGGDSAIQTIALESPGALLEDGLKAMRKFVSIAAAAEPGRDQGIALSNLRNLVTNYLTTALTPSQKHGAFTRPVERELRTLAAALDSLIAGGAAAVGDILMQRFRAVELAQEEGWVRAGLLEAIANPGVSSIPTGLRNTIARESRDLQKLAPVKGKGKEGGPRG